MTVRVDVRPQLLVWARERSGLDPDALSRRFPKLEAWELGARAPTLKQLESFAKATHTPIGFFFLSEPPEEHVPIPDLRTYRDARLDRPSPDLLETIFQSQERQEWYRDHAQLNGEEPVSFVGSLTTAIPIIEAATAMRETLDFSIDARGASWTDALRMLADHAEAVGVLVMVNGVVGSNTHRKLDPGEFRGFALVDPYAPLVFVNGADTKAAQIFTLAHELAHIWLGQSALSDADLERNPVIDAERWCNRVAAELLVPRAGLSAEFRTNQALPDELNRLARLFKVSTLVVLRRVYDAGHLEWNEYRAAYDQELNRLLELMAERSTSGGDFYNTQPVRVGKRFARAVLASTLEGQTLHRDAFRLLGFKKHSTFAYLVERLGVA